VVLTERARTSQDKETAFEKGLPFGKNERIQVSAAPDMPYQSERRSIWTEL